MFDALAIPTPFQVGPVNAYLAGRTLVDPGPDSEEAWAALVGALESRELTPDDVEQVLITHPHPDHFGNARRLRDRGARVLASAATADIVGDFRARLEYEQTYFTPLLERWGVSGDAVETTLQLPEAFLPYVEDVTIDTVLAAGDEVTVDDRLLTVDECVGHAPGELLFAYDGDGSGADTDEGTAGDEDGLRTALVGDHVLPDTTPNPFLQPPEDPDEADGERPHVLPRYDESLRSLATEGYGRFLPGHGDEIPDPEGRIEAILTAHEERTENVRASFDGPTSPSEVMHALFGDLPATEVFAGMSEAVGHLDLLEERGEVEAREHGGLIVYELVE